MLTSILQMNTDPGRIVPFSDQIGSRHVGGRSFLTASGRVSRVSPRKPAPFSVIKTHVSLAAIMQRFDGYAAMDRAFA